MSLRPINRPVQVVKDYSARRFEHVDLNLFDLFAHEVGAGLGLINHRTFVGCRIQGPAIMLVSAGVTFNDTNFGDSGGDVRNLILYPAGGRALGTVPMRECHFEGCEFYNVGFTGPREFLDEMLLLNDGKV
jgi:hypothetical protein